MDRTKFFGSKEASTILGIHSNVGKKKGIIETISSPNGKIFERSMINLQ